jgi:PAS domain S-box-containing protein
MKIFFVEDQPADVELAMRVLNNASMSFTACQVQHRTDYLEVLSSFQPDVILCDHTLPGFDSAEALELLRQTKLRSAFILLTGSVPEDYALECIKRGADDYILKSNLKRLPIAIEKAFAEKALQRQKQLDNEKLKERDLLISLVTGSLPVVNYLVEVNSFRVKYISASVKEITGYDADCFLNDPDFWRERVHPDDGHLINKSVEDLLERNNFDRYYRWRVADGSYRWFHDKINLIEKEGIFYTIGVWIDITGQKELEQKLNQKIRDLDTFLYHTSHSLRSPISSIEGLVNLGRKNCKEQLTSQLWEMVDKCNTQMNAILNNLNSVAVVLGLPVKHERVSLKREIPRLVNTFAKSFDGEDLAVKVKLRGKTNIYTDKPTLFLILQELLKNAAAFRKSGMAPDVTVEITVTDTIELKVTDNGQGIMPGIQDRVFDMFYRGNDQPAGAGLGLFIVKNAVEKLRGTVSLKSEVNKGTEVTVVLPDVHFEEITPLTPGHAMTANEADHRSTDDHAGRKELLRSKWCVLRNKRRLWEWIFN